MASLMKDDVKKESVPPPLLPRVPTTPFFFIFAQGAQRNPQNSNFFGWGGKVGWGVEV
jgi:hypothetical protein